jgi:hypothetical protein
MIYVSGYITMYFRPLSPAWLVVWSITVAATSVIGNKDSPGTALPDPGLRLSCVSLLFSMAVMIMLDSPMFSCGFSGKCSRVIVQQATRLP